MMVDLALNVRTAAAKEYADREALIEGHGKIVIQVNKSKRTNHILSGLLAVVAMVSNIVLCFPNLMPDHNQSVTFSIATSIYFTLVALLLMWSLINLLLTFRINNLPKELINELCKIIIFMIYYSIAFSIRAVAVVLVYFDEWPQFNRYW